MGLDQVDAQMGQGEGEEDGVKGSGGKDRRRENHGDMRGKRDERPLVRHHPGGLEQEIGERVGEEEGGEGCGHGHLRFQFCDSKARSDSCNAEKPAV